MNFSQGSDVSMIIITERDREREREREGEMITESVRDGDWHAIEYRNTDDVVHGTRKLLKAVTPENRERKRVRSGDEERQKRRGKIDITV